MTEFLSVSDLSKKLNIPKSTIYDFARKGKIPGVFRIGKHWRFRADMIEQWIEEQTKPKALNLNAPFNNPLKGNLP